MKVRGRVWKFGDNIDTDAIIPARYLNTSDPSELATHCMEDADPSFASKVQKGDIILAGTNFGCGSSREHAPISIKSAGVSCVVAVSFARIFYRNSINIGLPILESSEAFRSASEGDLLEVDFDAGRIINVTTGAQYTAQPFPAMMQEIIADGGLIGHVRKKVGKNA